MEARQPGTTKYRVVKDYVLRMVNSGEYVADQRIPSESEFIGMFGVSSITVRRAMNELVSEGIIYRIKGKGSFVSGQRPRFGARGSGSLVAFVLSGLGKCDPSYMQIIKGIQSYISTKGYSLILEYTEDSTEQENAIINRFIENNIEGLLIYPSNPQASIEVFRRIRDRGIPFVVLDRHVSSFPVNFVSDNNHDGAFAAVEHLTGLGHIRVAFVGFTSYLSSEQERYQGYCDALRFAGIEPDPTLAYLSRDPHELDMAALVRRVLDGDMTAIFAANDRRALEIIEVFGNHGIRIPDEVSLVGYDDFEPAKYSLVPLTTVRQNFEQLGYEAAKLLFKSMKYRDNACKIILLPNRLVVRQSTAPPAKKP